MEAEMVEFERKPLYSPTEYAKIIGADPSTVMDWIHRDQLYALQLGPKTFRIPLAVVMSRLNPEAAKPTQTRVEAAEELKADEARLRKRAVLAE